MKKIDKDLAVLIEKIKYDKGLDFSEYRQSTLKRRVRYRMELDGAASIGEYIKILNTNENIYRQLISSLLINVTDFFRDGDIWIFMKEKVLPEIVERKLKNKKFREFLDRPFFKAWVCGCADGQEAYSLAICLKDILKEKKIDLEIRIYATDVDAEAVKKARKGEYSAEIISKLPISFYEEYFIPFKKDSIKEAVCCKTEMFRLKRYIRDMLIFGRHNLVSDFYIGNLDLIVCRNVFIYFQRKLQDKVVKGFSRALKNNGMLWLGAAESLSENTNYMFEAPYKQQRIFRKLQI